MANSPSPSADTVYDLLLPQDLSCIVSLHWDEQSPPEILRNRRDKLRSFRLRDYLSSEDTRLGRGWRQRLSWCPETFPLAPGSVECIVLHHALEEPPVTRLGRRATRRKLLRFCKGLLGPSGVLAIACKNRWSADKLRGALSAPTSQLPLAVVGGGLSLRGCHRLLHRAAFKVSEAFAVVPSMESPVAIISIQREAATMFYNRTMAQTFSNLPRILVPVAGLLSKINARPYLEPTFFVLARHD